MSVIPTKTLEDFEQQLDQVASRDRYGLIKCYQRLRKLPFSSSATYSKELARFKQKLSESLAWVAERSCQRKSIHFSEDLPISQKRGIIAEAISQHQVVVIAGETGSGKTTQLPKICLDQGRGVQGLIGHTQPRRLAARSVASRIAEELDTDLGGLVGYQVRFSAKISDLTAVKLMTDGILLADIQKDRYLTDYDTLIIDEAHERSLNIDFLLGYLKQLLPKRPDLKVIITSATIDVDKFSRHFDDAPVITVSGRTFPVTLCYRPAPESKSHNLQDAIVNCVQEILTLNHQGDILVFLAREQDIRETALRLRREHIPHVEILPLYARLSHTEQSRIFQSHRGRRIVLATNVAETALTVPGIRYVIDTGYARISRYSFRTKVQRLPVEAISQASANQRKGRCGRTSEGICYRLYSEQDFISLPEYTDPEILRTNLATVILQMAQLKLGDLRRFPFVDKPDHRLIDDGYRLLSELQAIGSNNRLTPLGRQMARLPVDPRLARMLLAASQRVCLTEMVTIVSFLSIQDPRERPNDQQKTADQQHRQYWHQDSDFMGLLNLWHDIEQQRQALSKNQFQKWCRNHFLAYNRVREWRDLHGQITVAAKQLSLVWNPEPGTYEAIHTALLTGLLSNIGFYDKAKKAEYLGSRNRRFAIFPGSSQFKKLPRWLLAAEIVETSKIYAHQVAAIQPDWILTVASHQVKQHYHEPHYHNASGQVMAFEKITLHGLVLSDKKRVSYSAIDPKLSREIFIRSALVEGKYSDHKRMRQKLKQQSKSQHFFQWQQHLLHEIQDIEAKARRRDLLVDDQVLFDFYDRRIPESVTSLDRFESWRKEAEQQQPQLLFIERQQLMRHEANQVTSGSFPSQLQLDTMSLPLVYQFDPTHRDDGVTVRVPVTILHQLTEAPLQWLVPGLLFEKITAIIKALPKQWRRQFVPVATTVEQILPFCQPERGALTKVISEQLYRKKGVKVPDEVWQAIKLEAYYFMNIHVLDETGKLIDSGRDIALLKARYRDRLQRQIQRSGSDIEQEGLTRWSFGELPKSVVLKQNGLEITAYPGLVDEGNSVALKLFDDPEEAMAKSLRGLSRLALLSQPQTVKYLRKKLLRGDELALSLVAMGKRDQVVEDILFATVKNSCFAMVESVASLIRDPESFSAAVDSGRASWVERAEAMAANLLEYLQQVAGIRQQISRVKNQLVLAATVPDIQNQLTGLFYSGCLYQTPSQWFQQYRRYLQAIQQRLEKAPKQTNKDRDILAQLEPLELRYQQRKTELGDDVAMLNEALIDYHWMLQELRVSMFAQALGTRLPVSIKRLNKQWELC